MTRMPRWRFDNRKKADFTAFSEALPKLAGVGLRIPVSWAHEQLGIPEAQDDKPVLQAAQSYGYQGQSEWATATAAPGRKAGKMSDVVDDQVELLEREAAKPVAGMVDAIRKVVNSASSLEELRDSLLDAWPDMPSEEFADVMTEALTAAHMAGRYEVLEGL